MSDHFNFGQKKCPKKNLPKYLQHSIKFLNTSEATSFYYGENSSRDTARDSSRLHVIFLIFHILKNEFNSKSESYFKCKESVDIPVASY